MRAYKQNELQLLAARVQKRYPAYSIVVSEMSLMGGMQKITEVTGCPRSSMEKIKQLEEESPAETSAGEMKK